MNKYLGGVYHFTPTMLNAGLLLLLTVVFTNSWASIRLPFDLSVNERHLLTKNVIVTSQYNIEFAQFTPEQVSQFHGFYTQYTGYIEHHLHSQNLTNTKIIYATQAGKSVLLNNLQKTAEHLGMQVLIRSAKQKISLQFMGVTERNLPYKEWE